jgi:hypothetical protein
MHLLRWLIILMTSPFWVPTLLTGVGILIAALGTIVFVIWLISLCIIIGILKTLYKLHLNLKEFYKKIWSLKW